MSKTVCSMQPRKTTLQPLLAYFLLPLVLAPLTYVLAVNSEQTCGNYRAAVYAHRPWLPSQLFPVSRTTAVRNMMKNVEIYRQQAQQAAKQGAKIIVFPEDGLYGFRFSRAAITAYLEPIPDPRQIPPWVPCTDPGRVQPCDILFQLSCIASEVNNILILSDGDVATGIIRENSIYLVANMGDLKPCNHTDDVSRKSCPPEGRFQYNTDVAFDPKGRLIARYHKRNLYQEHQFDTPDVEIVTFDTPFGRFGLFTCFDILFHDPAILLVENGITDIAFPTFWSDEYPVLNAIGFHSAWARGNRVNLLAANVQMPVFGAVGSGIYTSVGPSDYYYNDHTKSQGRLVVADVPRVFVPDKMAPDSSAIVVKFHLHAAARYNSIKKRLRKPWKSDTEVGRVAHNDPNVGRDTVVLREDIATAETDGDGAGREDVFAVQIGGDVFRMVYVTGGAGSRSVCSGPTCCHLTYQKEAGPADLYAFGAFQGAHVSEKNWFAEVCLLVFCTEPSPSSCGRVPRREPSTVFTSFVVSGNFSTSYVYPEVLVSSNGSLALTSRDQWDYTSGRLQTLTPLSQPLLVAALYARAYSRDVEQGSSCSRQGISGL